MSTQTLTRTRPAHARDLRVGDRFTIGDGRTWRITHAPRTLGDGRILLRVQSLTDKGRPFSSFRTSARTPILRVVA